MQTKTEENQKEENQKSPNSQKIIFNFSAIPSKKVKKSLIYFTIIFEKFCNLIGNTLVDKLPQWLYHFDTAISRSERSTAEKALTTNVEQTYQMLPSKTRRMLLRNITANINKYIETNGSTSHDFKSLFDIPRIYFMVPVSGIIVNSNDELYISLTKHLKLGPLAILDRESVDDILLKLLISTPNVFKETHILTILEKEPSLSGRYFIHMSIKKVDICNVLNQYTSDDISSLPINDIVKLIWRNLQSLKNQHTETHEDDSFDDANDWDDLEDEDDDFDDEDDWDDLEDEDDIDED